MADCDSAGEVVNGSIHEINYDETVTEVREQIQEDIITYLAGRHESSVQLDGDDLCQIVVDNFQDLK